MRPLLIKLGTELSNSRDIPVLPHQHIRMHAVLPADTEAAEQLAMQNSALQGTGSADRQ